MNYRGEKQEDNQKFPVYFLYGSRFCVISSAENCTEANFFLSNQDNFSAKSGSCLYSSLFMINLTQSKNTYSER